MKYDLFILVNAVLCNGQMDSRTSEMNGHLKVKFGNVYLERQQTLHLGLVLDLPLQADGAHTVPFILKEKWLIKKMGYLLMAREEKEERALVI